MVSNRSIDKGAQTARFKSESASTGIAKRNPSPTTTPPTPTSTSPTRTDAGERKPKQGPVTPHTSLHADAPHRIAFDRQTHAHAPPSQGGSVRAPTRQTTNCARLGDVIQSAMFRYDPAAKDMAERILAAVGFHSSSQAEMQRERANFARAYHDLLAEGFGSEAMTWFDRELLKRATRIGSARSGNSNSQAYMRKTFDNLAADLRRRIKPRDRPTVRANAV